MVLDADPSRVWLRPFGYTQSEKEEVWAYLREVIPNFDQAPLYFDNLDVPSEEVNRISFLDLDQSEVQKYSQDLLREAREYMADLRHTEGHTTPKT